MTPNFQVFVIGRLMVVNSWLWVRDEVSLSYLEIMVVYLVGRDGKHVNKFKREGVTVDKGYRVISVEQVIKTIRDQQCS